MILSNILNRTEYPSGSQHTIYILLKQEFFAYEMNLCAAVSSNFLLSLSCCLLFIVAEMFFFSCLPTFLLRSLWISFTFHLLPPPHVCFFIAHMRMPNQYKLGEFYQSRV